MDEPCVVRTFERPAAEVVERLGSFGVATIHEAMGQRGLVAMQFQLRGLAGAVINAGDDDVVVVPRSDAERIADLAQRREEREASYREKYRAGELSLDVNGIRQLLTESGVRYFDKPPE